MSPRLDRPLVFTPLRVWTSREVGEGMIYTLVINQPGYLPESGPYDYPTLALAREGLVEWLDHGGPSAECEAGRVNRIGAKCLAPNIVLQLLGTNYVAEIVEHDVAFSESEDPRVTYGPGWPD